MVGLHRRGTTSVGRLGQPKNEQLSVLDCLIGDGHLGIDKSEVGLTTSSRRLVVLRSPRGPTTLQEGGDGFEIGHQRSRVIAADDDLSFINHYVPPQEIELGPHLRAL